MEPIVTEYSLEIKDLTKLLNKFTVLSITIGQKRLQHFWCEFRNTIQLDRIVNNSQLHYFALFGKGKMK